MSKKNSNKEWVGKIAPDFELVNQDGECIRLSDLRGHKVVLFFYTKDNTPGCTTEAKGFSQEKAFFEQHNVRVFGISKDSVISHQKFIQKQNLTCSLLSDESGVVLDSFSVWKEKSLYGKTFMGIERSTFLIDENGVIQAYWPKVKVAGHIEAVKDVIING